MKSEQPFYTPENIGTKLKQSQVEKGVILFYGVEVERLKNVHGK